MPQNDADACMLDAIATVSLGARVVKYKPELSRPACFVQSSRGRYSAKELVKIAANGESIAAIPGEQFVFYFVQPDEKLEGVPLFNTHGIPMYVFKTRAKMTPRVPCRLIVGECPVIVPPDGNAAWFTAPTGEIPVIPDALVEKAVKEYLSPVPEPAVFEPDALIPEYVKTIRDNLFRFRSEDLSYVCWHRLLCVCHRGKAEGRALFLDWFNQTRGTKWNEGFVSHVESLFDDLDKLTTVEAREAEGTKILDARWFLEWICEQDTPITDEIIPDAPAEELTEDELKAIADKEFEALWPLLPLTGCLERFRQDLIASMPWQDEACYAVPVMCLQFALQRKIVYRHDGLQSHWWCLVGGPASNKSEMKRIIKEVLNPIEPRIAIENVQSVNGLKAQLVSYPSRVLLMDEGLKYWNSVLCNEGKDPVKSEILSQVLNLHNNKMNIEETGNRHKNQRLPKIILPQLTLVTFDQNAYWAQFRTGSAIDNGLLSRFFVIKLNQMPKLSSEKDKKRISSSEIKRFSGAIRNLLPPSQEVHKGEDGENEYHSWSPIDLDSPSQFEYAPGTLQVFHDFNDSMILWSEGDEETRTPILHRLAEAVRLIAQLLAFAENRNCVVTPQHARIAAGLAFRTVHATGAECSTAENQILKSAALTINANNGSATLTQILKKIPKKLRSPEGSWMKNSKFVKEFFPVKNGRHTLPE